MSNAEAVPPGIPADVPSDAPSDVPNEKAALRSRLLARRRALAPERRAAAARGAAARLDGALGDARTVAAYVPVGPEPGGPGLPDMLRASGRRVLLPVLLPGNDLDWAEYSGHTGELAPAGRGLREPTGPRLGPAAVLGADAVLLPGLAVDAASGVRMGRGGGSYDRVLERLEAAGSPARLLVLLYHWEVLQHVPSEPHDRPVHAAVTDTGVVAFER